MKDTAKYKKMLEDELRLLESELRTVGRKNPENPNDWEAMPQEKDTWRPDEQETADKIEGYEANTAILKQLEIRYNNVKGALKRVEEGGFGVCEVGGEEIEEARLLANPAASTCMKHMKP